MRALTRLAVLLVFISSPAFARDRQYDDILAVGRIFQFAFGVERPSEPVYEFMAKTLDGKGYLFRTPEDPCIYQMRVGELAFQINFNRWPGTYRLSRQIVPIITLQGDARDFRCHRRLMPDEAEKSWTVFEPGNCWHIMGLTVMGGDSEFAATMRALQHIATNVCPASTHPY